MSETPYREPSPGTVERAWKRVDEHLKRAKESIEEIDSGASRLSRSALKTIRLARQKVKRFFDAIADEE